MRPFVLSLILAFSIIVAACGDDADPVIAGDSDPTTPAVDDGDQPGDDGDAADPTTPPDQDLPLGAGPYPIAELTIDYSHQSNGIAYSYDIVCLGDTATLIGTVEGVTDQRACAALADPAVQERLIAGAPADQVCTEQYGGDDTAVITGRIDDQPVDTTVDRANGCGIDDWDRLLPAILPPPMGV